MVDFAYAVHTDVCTYLLDDTGICVWVLSANPLAAAKLAACVGAQFVACVDQRVEGAIVGDLKEGASALLVATSPDTGRAQLMRTGPIRSVQYHDPSLTDETVPSLDVLEEVELELIEDSQVTSLPTDPKAEGHGTRNLPVAVPTATRDPKRAPDKARAVERPVVPPGSGGTPSVIITHSEDRPAVTPARSAPKPPRPGAIKPARPRTAVPEFAGLPAPKKPSLESADPDDTQKFPPRRTRR
jgi:hypothetical protein